MEEGSYVLIKSRVSTEPESSLGIALGVDVASVHVSVKTIRNGDMDCDTSEGRDRGTKKTPVGGQ